MLTGGRSRTRDPWGAAPHNYEDELPGQRDKTGSASSPHPSPNPVLVRLLADMLEAVLRSDSNIG